MKLYRILLILLVILMSCSQQSSKDKDKEKPGATKTGNKRKQKGIKYNKLDEKSVDDETSDNNAGKEGEIKDNNAGKEDNSGDIKEETLYAMLEKKVKELRGKYERAKNKFNEEGHSFPNKEERSSLFPNIQDPKERTEKVFLSEKYSFVNIVKMMRQQFYNDFPDLMDDTYAGLEYDTGLLTEVDKMITKLNHENQGGDPYWFYNYFLNRIGAVGEFNRRVLYGYLSDATLAKLKSGNDADIEKANKLLDKFMKKKADLVELIKSQIKAVENKEKRSDFYVKFMKPRQTEMEYVYEELKESRKNIEEFCLRLNK
ncbi:hypothetical protein DB313_04935 (plasmid) [Borrelia turcica IST7]|uniref:Uncharacterized protein n=1 Tax=Borrelia turcica IST7 TaxID=1104446 RepID=A0A386PMR6_9SPIR|nr:hypothetical protein [Borrelia turcica]AYE36846.1 hypothetical protein DB313_04935 [Borrelia turcica IST7]